MKKKRRSPTNPVVLYPDGPHPLDLKLLAEFHPEAPDTAKRISETVVAYRNGKGVSAEIEIHEFIMAHKGSHRDWHLMCDVVLDYAKMDPRYYGINDPNTERRCTICRKTKHTDAFRGKSIQCIPCKEKADAEARVHM